MGGAEEQRAIINSELYWYGGLRDSNCHQIDNVDKQSSFDEQEANEQSGRHMHVWRDEAGQMQMKIDPVDGGCFLKGTVEVVEPGTPDC